jgi:hypothetical protein
MIAMAKIVKSVSRLYNAPKNPIRKRIRELRASIITLLLSREAEYESNESMPF